MMSQYSQGSPFAQPAPQTQYAIMSQYGQPSPFGQPPQPQYGYGQPMYGMYAGGPPHTPVSLISGEATRTIYLGNVTREMNIHDILNYVRHGLVESFRTCYEKNCAFLTFVDPNSAQAFFQEFLVKKMIVNDTEIKLGWGKPTTIHNTLKLQIQGGATRCVYLGRINESHTEEFIRDAASQYGPLEHIKIIRDKNIAFVHFLNIMSAAKCVGALSKEPGWAGVRVNYGKDRCCNHLDYNPYGFQPFQSTQQQQQQLGYEHYNPYTPMQPTAGPIITPDTTTLRTLYLGNIHPEAKTEDLCNIIRGGNLVQLKLLHDKHIAFVTFLDASTALDVYNYAQTIGLVIRGRKIRVGWGKPSSISAHVAQAIQQGATRNVYVGNIPDSLTVEKLKSDFGCYGEIELVNAFKEKKCAFVNYACIESAVVAINGMRSNPEYAGYKLNYGKDRCGNPFKHPLLRKAVAAAATTAAAVAAAPSAPAPASDPPNGSSVSNDDVAPNAANSAEGDAENDAGASVDADANTDTDANAAVESKDDSIKHVDEHEDDVLHAEKHTSIVDDIPEPPPPSAPSATATDDTRVGTA